jgi:hypothetical protein
LTQSTRQRDQNEKRGDAARQRHQKNDAAKADGDTREDGAAAEPVDQSPDAETEQAADERRREVDLRVRDPADSNVAEKWFRDETEALRSAGQRAHHRQCRHAEHDPPVVHAPARLASVEDSDTRIGHEGRCRETDIC